MEECGVEDHNSEQQSSVFGSDLSIKHWRRNELMMAIETFWNDIIMLEIAGKSSRSCVVAGFMYTR